MYRSRSGTSYNRNYGRRVKRTKRGPSTGIAYSRPMKRAVQPRIWPADIANDYQLGFFYHTTSGTYGYNATGGGTATGPGPNYDGTNSATVNYNALMLNNIPRGDDRIRSANQIYMRELMISGVIMFTPSTQKTVERLEFIVVYDKRPQPAALSPPNLYDIILTYVGGTTTIRHYSFQNERYKDRFEILYRHSHVAAPTTIDGDFFGPGPTANRSTYVPIDLTIPVFRTATFNGDVDVGVGTTGIDHGALYLICFGPDTVSGQVAPNDFAYKFVFDYQLAYTEL